MKNIRNDKGITLISLTVTIIVMLILTAVIVRTIDGTDVIDTMEMVEDQYDENMEQTKRKTRSVDGEWGEVIEPSGFKPELQYNH